MRHVSFGRHRGADWLSRVAYPLEASAAAQPGTPFYERFVLRLRDPRHARSLWVALSLERDADGARARCSAAYFDGDTPRVQLAEEVWPLSRAAIDPDRGGLGVGECQLQPDHAHGLVHGEGFALAWDVALRPTAPPQPLVADWLYRHRRLPHKASVPVPLATVTKGHVEVWHALGRAAPRTRLDVAGWHASLHHAWGDGVPDVYASAHAHVIEGAPPGAFVHATAGRTKLCGMLEVAPQLGILQLGAAPASFSGWQALRRPAPAQTAADGWALHLVGDGQRFVGEVRGQTVATAAGPFGRPLYVCELAELTATYTPRGEHARTVRAPRASFEVMGAAGELRDGAGTT